MKYDVYVASSWRNPIQPLVVHILRLYNYKVYDFRNPAPGDHGFHWSEIDPTWKDWTPAKYVDALNEPLPERGFDSDFGAMMNSRACLLVLPCGRSAHLEAGYFRGVPEKKLIILIPRHLQFEPELMYKMAHHICLDMDEVIAVL